MHKQLILQKLKGHIGQRSVTHCHIIMQSIIIYNLRESSIIIYHFRGSGYIYIYIYELIIIINLIICAQAINTTKTKRSYRSTFSDTLSYNYAVYYYKYNLRACAHACICIRMHVRTCMRSSILCHAHGTCVYILVGVLYINFI